MSRLVAIPSLLFATLLFGGSNVVQKSVLNTLDVWSSMGFRGLIAAMVLLPFSLIELRKHNVSPLYVLQKSAPVAIWFTAGMIFQILATKHTTATNLGFLINTCVVVVPFLLWFQTKKAPTAYVASISLMCFVGACLLSGSAPTSFGWGDATCVVSALCYSVWIVTLGSMMREAAAPVTVTFLQWLGPATIGLALGPQDVHSLAHAASVGPELFFLGAISSGIGFILAARAQAIISPCASAVCYSMEAVFGAAIAYAWLGESLTPTGLLGAAIMLVAIILIQYEPQHLPKRARVEPRFV